MNKQQIQRYLKEHELDIQKANAAYFIVDLVYPSYVTYKITAKKYFSPVSFYMSYKTSSLFYQIINRRLVEEVTKNVFLDYLKNPGFFNDKFKKRAEISENINFLWNQYNKKKNISTKELLDLYDKMIPVYRKWWHFGIIGEDKGDVINLEIVPRFQKRNNISKEDAQEIINLLSHPDEESYFTKERKDFLNLSLYVLKRREKKEKGEALKNKLFKQKVIDYIKKYFWMKTDFYSAIEITPEIVYKDILNEIKENNISSIEKELKKFEISFKKISDKKKEILSKIKLSPADKKDIKFAQLMTYWCDTRKEQYMKGFYYLLMVLRDIAQKFNLDYHTIAMHSVDEVRELLKNNKKLKKKEIQRRDNGVFVIYEYSNKYTCYYHPFSKKMLEIAIRYDKRKEISGKVANKSKERFVKGVIKIITDPAKEKLNKDEILVTSMTRVEFVPIIIKAKAIITDEGGIASHAAIVSREIGIPCIIGTKVATKVLKNGDYVEIDTEKGVVRKIK